MTRMLRRLVRDESGQDIIEYALIAAGIATMLIPMIPTLATAITGLYTRIGDAINGVPVGGAGS